MDLMPPNLPCRRGFVLVYATVNIGIFAILVFYLFGQDPKSISILLAIFGIVCQAIGIRGALKYHIDNTNVYRWLTAISLIVLIIYTFTYNLQASTALSIAWHTLGLIYIHMYYQDLQLINTARQMSPLNTQPIYPVLPMNEAPPAYSEKPAGSAETYKVTQVITQS